MHARFTRPSMSVQGSSSRMPHEIWIARARSPAARLAVRVDQRNCEDHVFIMIIVLDSAARVHRHPHVNGKYLISPNLIKFRRILVCDTIDCIFVGVAVPHTTLWLWFLLKQPLNSIDVYIVAMITTPALFQHIFKKKTRVEHQRTLYIRPPCTLLTRSICLITTSHRMEIFDASSN